MQNVFKPKLEELLYKMLALKKRMAKVISYKRDWLSKRVLLIGNCLQQKICYYVRHDFFSYLGLLPIAAECSFAKLQACNDQNLCDCTVICALNL